MKKADVLALDAKILEQALLFCQIKAARTEAIKKRNSQKCTETDGETVGPCRLYEAREEREWCEACRLHEDARREERSLKSTENRIVRSMRKLYARRTHAAQA